MASANYQYELIKMYLAAFIRPPEKSGLEYWLLQLNSGKSFNSVLETVFNLDIVKEIYPINLSYESFVTLIYANVFGKSPDLEGLNYWKQQMIDGRARGNLVMDMINAGLSTPDGTAGKAYIVNRMAVSQFAVDQQFVQKADLSPSYLKTVMQGVNAFSDTVPTAIKSLGSAATGIGLGAPVNALIVAAAADGLSATEVAVGVDVVVDLFGTNAVANNVVELLIDGRPFPTAIAKQLSAADITAKKISLSIPKTMNWGADGIKLLQVILKDSNGTISSPGGDLRVDLNLVAPKAPSYALSVAAAIDGINLVEKSAGVTVSVNLTNTNAVAGDKVEILLNGVSFGIKILATLTAADIARGMVDVVISGGANWGVDGDKVLAAKIIDIAGNIGDIGGAVNVTLDTVVPTAPSKPIQIPVAAGGISALERASPISVIVDLTGTNAKLGDAVELLIDDQVFGLSTFHVLTTGEIFANTVTLSISASDIAWSAADSNRIISARLLDKAGNFSKGGGNLTVVVDSEPPKTDATTFTIAAASDGISGIEKTAGVAVVVNLVGSGAVAGDTVNILSGAQSPVTLFSQVLTAAQITAKQAIVTIPSGSAWGADGSKTISVSFTDIAGNISSTSPSLNIVLDTTAPLAPIADPLVAVPVPVSLNGINTTEKNAGVVVIVNLTGTQAVAKDKVEILLNGVSFPTPVLQVLTTDDVSNNTVSVTIPGNATWGTDGIKLVAARLIDIAGNIGVAGVASSVTLDTTAPAGPTAILAVSANSVGGITAAEKIAGVGVVVDLTGTSVVAGDLVEILIGGLSFANPVTHILTAAEILAKSVTVTIGGTDGWGADGAKILTARFTDIAGNIGSGSGALTVTIDTGAPNPPATPLVVAAAANGINSTEKSAGISVVINLNGTGAVAGDTIHLLLDGVQFATPVTHTITAAEITAKSATMIIPGNAAWGIDSNRVLTATITDALGNASVQGGSLTVVVDTTGSTAPTNPMSILVATNGISSAEKTAGVSVGVDLTGTGLVAGESVELLLNHLPFATAVTKTLSALEVTNGLANVTIPSTANWGVDGSKIISIRGLDSAGNIGVEGGDLTVTLDTVAPAAPTNLVTVAANSGGGITAAEKNAGVVVDVNLVGTTLFAGDKVELLIGGAAWATPVIHTLTGPEIAANVVSLTIGANDGWGADGTKTISARFIDIAGNIGSGGGGASVLMLDTTPPSIPNSPMSVAAAANGGINLNEKNAGVAVVVSLAGTNAVAGDVATLLIGGVGFAVPITHTITAGEVTAGNFTFTVNSNDGWGVDGSKVLSMSMTDLAGNAGAAGGNVTVSIDATVPNAPSSAISVPAAASGINLAEKTSGVVGQVDLTATNAVAGDKVEILLGGVPFSSPVFHILSSADITAGIASVTITSSAGWGADGVKSLSARIQDSVGNIGLAGGSLLTTLDTVIPTTSTLPTYTDVNNSSTINAGDTYVFLISEATNKAITTSEVLISNSHLLGTGATAVWSPDGTQLTVTLGAGTTLASGDIVTLVGVSDVAGNSSNIAFSI